MPHGPSLALPRSRPSWPHTPRGNITHHPADAVLDCHVTLILGLYDTAEEAGTAAAEFGRRSFAYELSDTERAALAAGK